MQLYDPQYVKYLAKQHKIQDDIDKEVSRAILTEVENELREIIQDAQKFQHQFKHMQLAPSDIDNALKNRGYNEETFGIDNANHLEYIYDKNKDSWVLKDQVIVLREKFIENELEALKKSPQRPYINLFWLQYDNQIPDTIENKFIINKQQILKKIDEQFEENERQFNILKDKPLSLLSKELFQFFTLITETIAKEEIVIDGQDDLFYKQSFDIQQIYDNLQNNTGINSLIPFLINYLFQDYNLIIQNGIKKKLITLQLIESLIKNPYINLEFYLHLLIKILLHFITASEFQLENTLEGGQSFLLRDGASRCLSMLIIKYGSKYFTLQQNVCDLLQQLLQECVELQNQQIIIQNYETIQGILQFFYYMPVNIIKECLFSKILIILQNQYFYKNLNGEVISLNQIDDQIQNNNSKNKIYQQFENKLSMQEQQRKQIIESSKISQNAVIIYNQIQKIVKKMYKSYNLLIFNSEQERTIFQQICENCFIALEPIQQEQFYHSSTISKYQQQRPNYANNMLTNVI